MAGMYGEMSNWPSPGSIGRNILEADPDAAYQRLMSQLGLEWRKDPWATWARQQKSPTYDHYVGYAAEHPETDYVEFLSNYAPDLRKQFGGLNSAEQGYKNPGGLGRLHYSGF